jgi:hypothetical protein
MTITQITGFAVSEQLNRKLVEQGRDKIPSQQIYNYIKSNRIPIVDEDGESCTIAEVQAAKSAGVKMKYFVTVEDAKVFIKNYLNGVKTTKVAKANIDALFDEVEVVEEDEFTEAELEELSE